ncbi:MAG: RNA polymerase sigma factor [Kofleriaceae bacterium]
MSTDPSDLDLLAAWRAGNDVAGQTLFKRHFRRIYRFFETKCNAEADELVQSTFLACVRAKNNFRGDSSFATYLFTIARHELYRVLSERRRDIARIDFDASSIEMLVPTPRTKIAEREDRARLLRVLRDLPVEQQMLLELHYWEEMDASELADVFETIPVTIRSRLSRAREVLREKLMKEADAPPAATSTLESLDAWARTLGQEKRLG